MGRFESIFGVPMKAWIQSGRTLLSWLATLLLRVAVRECPHARARVYVIIGGVSSGVHVRMVARFGVLCSGHNFALDDK